MRVYDNTRADERCIYLAVTRGGVLSAGKGSDVLMEGNVFKNVKQQNKADLKTQEGGRSYVPFKREDSNRCTATLGRPCAANLLLESAQYNWGLVAQTLTTFKVSFPPSLAIVH